MSAGSVIRTVPVVTRAELFAAALEAVEGDEFELARRLQLDLNTAQRQFFRWRRDEGMNFETTIQLLEIAGLLKTDANES